MEKCIDIHVHFGSPGGDGSGCYWSTEFEKMPAYHVMRLVTGTIFGKVSSERVKKHMIKLLDKSKRIRQIVLLALDESYNQQGEKLKSHLHVPNEYVRKLSLEDERILFGASIHPYKSQAIDELDRCLSSGAVLCKWLPSAQAIDPENPLCDPFYARLAKSRLPLLCHVGPEGAIPPVDDWSRQKLNSPRKLRKALAMGVTVIAAHCALPLIEPPLGSEADLDELLDLFQEAKERSWELYADLSALFMGTRGHYVDRVKTLDNERLIFASDYPIPILSYENKNGPGFSNWLKRFTKDIFSASALDRNVELIEENNFSESVFSTADMLFARIIR